MKKISQIVFLSVFCGILGLSFLIFNLFSDKLSMDNHENRLLTGLPAVLHSPPSQLLTNLDSFFVDNSPFRYQLVVLDASIDYTLFGSSQSDQVLPGKDGWLFYRDGVNEAQPVANYQGLESLYYDEETLRETAQALQTIRDRLAENGCTLVVDLTPKKDRIYREYMPDGYPIQNEENRTDRFAQYLCENTDLLVNWQYQTLRTAALDMPDRPLYYKTDTHWNSLGALISLDGVFALLGMDTLPAESYNAVETDIVTGDMANVAALYMVLPDEYACEVAGYGTLFGQDGRTVGVLGDSFSEYYMPYLESRFSGCWRQTLDTLTPELAADPGCDVLIIEANERSVASLIALSKQFLQ